MGINIIYIVLHKTVYLCYLITFIVMYHEENKDNSPCKKYFVNKCEWCLIIYLYKLYTGSRMKSETTVS